MRSHVRAGSRTTPLSLLQTLGNVDLDPAAAARVGPAPLPAASTASAGDDDGAKKTRARRRHIATDTLSPFPVVAAAAANTGDRDTAADLLFSRVSRNLTHGAGARPASRTRPLRSRKPDRPSPAGRGCGR